LTDLLRRFSRSVNELIPRDLLSRISEAKSSCEEGFFTEWKQGNTPYEKPRNPAFGGAFFLFLHVEANIVLLCPSTMLS
jgi:hypothetical protein